MLKRLTIRQRILITFTIIVLSGSILQLMIAGRQLQLASLEFYHHHLEKDALSIAATLTESMEHYLKEDSTQELQQILATFQEDEDYAYLIVDSSYRIVDYTPDTGYETLDRVHVTKEFRRANENLIGTDVRDDVFGERRIYVAVAMQHEQDILGYLVLTRPMRPAYTEVYEQWLRLGSTSLPVIGLVIVASLWLSGTISRPVEQLRNAALKMAEGALNTRSDNDSQDEVGQLSRAFNYMAEQLEGLMKTQRSFVSNAAHELRTPLMTLKLRVEAMEDEMLSPTERQRYMEEIQREIDHMAELVSSLLVLARIDEGRHKRNGSLGDTASALRDIARHWRIEATNAALEFETKIPADLPDLPLMPNDLRLMLDNLLGNAVKYTPVGKILFTVEHDGGQIIMRVCDSGIGFNLAQTDQLFTRFYRSEDARANYEGNGLGLSIVQAILEQYGGSISAQSPGINQGAVFVMSLPLSAEGAPAFA